MFVVKNTYSFLLLAGTIIAFTSQVESILNCQSTSSIEAAYKSCLHEEGIDIKLVNHQSTSLENALVSEQADVFCSYPRDSYKTAMECIGGVTRQCMPEEYKFLLPMPHQWGEMISKICDHRQDLDLQCATRQSHNSNQCGQRKGQEFREERGQPSTRELQCWAFEAEFECVLEQYSICGCMTAKVYSDIILDIMMPSTCGQKEELKSRRLVCLNTPKSTTPLPALPDHVTANCYSVSDLKGSVIECFTNENIHDKQLFDSFKNSASPPNTLMETLFLHYGDSACSSLNLRYKEAFRCTLQLLRDCTPATYKKFLPSADTAGAHVDFLCENRKDLDLLCASKKSAALTSCAKNKGMNYAASGGSTSGNEFLCFAFKAEFECIQEVYKACGCNTARIYSDMSLNLHYPKTCPKEELEHRRLHCQNHHTNPPAVDMVPSGKHVSYNMDNLQCLEGRKQEMMKCYTARGFQYYDDGRSHKEPHIFYGSILDTVMYENNDMCSPSKIQAAKAAVECEAEIIHFCLSTEEKRYFIVPEQLVEVFDSLCHKWKDIDGRCAYRQLKTFGHCLPTSDSSTYSDLLFENQQACRKMNHLGDCSKDILITCGCPTAKAYSDVIFGVMMPPACSQSADTPHYIKCDASNPYTYKHHPTDGNGANRLPCTAWSLALALCLASFFFRYL